MVELTATFHFHVKGTSRPIRGYRGVGVPRVGDEVRLEADRFYKVLRVVWVYDEPGAIGQRVNIELEPVA